MDLTVQIIKKHVFQHAFREGKEDIKISVLTSSEWYPIQI